MYGRCSVPLNSSWIILYIFYTLRWLENFSINFSAFHCIHVLLGGTPCWGLEMMIVSTFFSDIWGGNSSQTHPWRCFSGWPTADACGSRQSFYDRNSLKLWMICCPNNEKSIIQFNKIIRKRSCRVAGFFSSPIPLKGIRLTGTSSWNFTPRNSANLGFSPVWHWTLGCEFCK